MTLTLLRLLLQESVTTAAPTPGTLYGVIGLSITTLGTVLVQWVSNHKKGKTRDNGLASTLTTHIDRKLAPLDIKLDSLSLELGKMTTEITRVAALVEGPNGDNGLRGDVRELKERVDDSERRERDRLERMAS